MGVPSIAFKAKPDLLLLISADFTSSPYCHNIELKRALERHANGEARVIPIILRYCDWETAAFSKLQALPTIQGGGIQPVTKWADQDEAFTAISAKLNSEGTAKGIRKAAEEIRANRKQ